MKKLFVISLGGSLIIPDKIDVLFIKNFKRIILKQIKKGNKFLIITGGGKLCRNYNQSLKSISNPSNTDLDWMGINTTWVNAKLVQLAFGKYAFPKISRDPAKKINFKQPILVGGGWKPGRSSDGATVKYASVYGAKTIINLSNVDYIYTKDPRKFKDAKKIEKASWDDFLKIIGRRWVPGKNAPFFDPAAAKMAKKNNITVINCNGKNLKNFQNILENKKFIGTKIQ
jgi:uridylate kinase